MPRGSRVDAPGAVHHVMGRGLEGRPIFIARADCYGFRGQLDDVLTESGAQCLAWALMTNHYHLILRTGTVRVSRIMARTLTSHGLGFNRRHGRRGYVFQDRYKSVLCEDDEYLLQLVRYVHLNPLRAVLVKDVIELEDHPWCGHGVVVGKRRASWQDVDAVLAHFGKRREPAIAAYRRFDAEGVGQAAPMLGPVRGGILRRAGGWEFVPSGTGSERSEEESLAGDDAFVNAALAGEQNEEARRSRLRRGGWTPARVIRRAAQVCGVEEDAVYGHGKRVSQTRARALACKWLVEDLGLSGAETARMLRISQSAVSRQVAHGHTIASDIGHRLEDISEEH